MRGTIASATGFVAIAILVGAFSIGSVSAGVPGAETIELHAEPRCTKVVDVGRAGPSAGDDVVVRVSLFADPERTDHAGVVWATCEQLTGRRIYCFNEIRLFARGELTSEGTQDLRADPPVFTDPITGGTGDFATARGEATVDFANGTLTLEVVT